MSHSLSDLLATDAELDLIAFREIERSEDPVFAGLLAMTQAVDAQPMTQAADVPTRFDVRPDDMGQPQINRAHKGGMALMATVALVLSSSGVAAAVCGDPLAPFHYVTKQVMRMAPHDSGRLPGWDLGGRLPLSSLPQAPIGQRINEPAGTTILAEAREAVRQQTGWRAPGGGYSDGGHINSPGSGTGSGRDGGDGPSRHGNRHPLHRTPVGSIKGPTAGPPLAPRGNHHLDAAGGAAAFRGILHEPAKLPPLAGHVHRSSDRQRAARVVGHEGHAKDVSPPSQ